MLFLPSPGAAVKFCEGIGLPSVSSTDGGRIDRIVMKAAPISIDGENIGQMTNPGRDMDEFVFGKQNWLLFNPPNPKIRDPFEGMSSLQRAMTKMKVQEDPNEIDIEDDEPEDHVEISRKDENGVLILPLGILCNLIG